MSQATISFAINIIAGIALVVLGILLRSLRARYKSRAWRKLWAVFLGKDLGIVLTTREGPLPRSTKRISFAEARVVTDLIPLLHSLSIRYILLDQEELAASSPGNWNLLVLGGPSVNETARRMIDIIQTALPFSWKLEPVGISIANRVYEPSYDSVSKKVTQDYGVIVRVPNPYDNSRQRWVVMVMGCHGFGTEGTAQVLRERHLSQELVKAVGDKPFVAIVAVGVRGGSYLVHVEEVYLLPSTLSYTSHQ